MLCEVPLTKEQQDFAAENHALVYKFLRDKCLPEDEFYDVVIFGYLKAVRDYLTRENLRKYTFATIAWKAMFRSLSNYFTKQMRKKHRSACFSIHLNRDSEGIPLEEAIPSRDMRMQEFEMRQILHDLAGRVSKQQMNIVYMKGYGYGIREIAKHEKLPMTRIKELLEETRKVLLALCYE